MEPGMIPSRFPHAEVNVINAEKTAKIQDADEKHNDVKIAKMFREYDEIFQDKTYKQSTRIRWSYISR